MNPNFRKFGFGELAMGVASIPPNLTKLFDSITPTVKSCEDQSTEGVGLKGAGRGWMHPIS